MTDHEDTSPIDMLQRANKIQSSLRNLAMLTVTIFALLVAGAVYFAEANYTLGVKGERAHAAICVLRQDLQRRVAASEQFLKDHPSGFGGVSASDLRSTIQSRKDTISALAEAHCENP